MKKMLRSFLELRVMSWARVGIFLWEAARERTRLHRVTETLGLPVFGSDALRALRALKPDAMTAFILGTGASAADLSDQKLEYIQSQFSIGVNQWILHPMIPDVYAYEFDPDVRLLQALDRPEVRDKVPHLLFLKPSRPEGFSNASHLPEFMRERSFLYSRVNMWTRRESNIGRDFRGIVSSKLGRKNPHVLLDNGASIARMMALCVMLGFRKVVLVGVDLNNVEYFWQKRPELLAKLGLSDFSSGQTGSLHETLRDQTRPFAIDTFVFSVNRACDGENFISVESEHSLLASTLAVFTIERAP